MGFLKAGAGALSGNLADQWKEMFYCDSLSQSILAAKGSKRTNDRTSNTKRDDNIISDGSTVVVNDGQCMIVVEQGKVVDMCAEPGEFIYDSQAAPSILAGSLGQSVANTFNNIGKRFTYGGDTGLDQRVYYFNTKEILGNKYGTANPVPFRVVDANIGLDIDIAVRCNGEYSYRIVDPLLFYTNVCGNIESNYDRATIASQLKSELLTELQPAFARISAMGVRYSAIPAHTTEVAQALDELLTTKWTELRGIRIISFGINSIAADAADEELIKNLQRSAVMRDPTMAAAVLTDAQAEAMKGAAYNEGNGGAFMAFAGMNMAANSGGKQASNLYQMGKDQTPTQADTSQTPQAAHVAPSGGFTTAAAGSASAVPATDSAAAPVPPAPPAPGSESAGAWTCSACGTQNTGKFCCECGSPRPVAPRYRCNNCGWIPEDQSKPPKFCPECGDPFNKDDMI